MNFLKLIRDSLLFIATAWQLIKNLYQARAHIHKADDVINNQPLQPSPIPEENMTTLNCFLEYTSACTNLAKAGIYAYNVLETVEPTCGSERYIPGLYFCQYLHPIAAMLATAETARDVVSYLKSKQNSPN